MLVSLQPVTVAGSSADGHASSSLRGAKAIVAGDGLLIERSRCGRRSRVGIVGHRLIAQRSDGQRVTGRAHPRSDPVAIHFADRRRGIRVGAIGVVVSRAREGGRGHDRRIHVLGLPGMNGIS